MASLLQSRLRSAWRRLGPFDRAVLISSIVLGVLYMFGLAVRSPQRVPPFLVPVRFLFYPTVILLLLRWLNRNRERLLWSLRNRLVVAYVFIAFVPVVLLVTMAAVSAYMVYTQLGAYLFRMEIESRIEKVSTIAESVARSGDFSVRALEASANAIPGLQIRVDEGAELLKRPEAAPAERFGGLVQTGNAIELRGVASRTTPRGAATVSAALPVTEDLLDTILRDMGDVQVTTTRPATPDDPRNLVLPLGEKGYVSIGRVSAHKRTLPAPASWLDTDLRVVDNVEAVVIGPDGVEKSTNPVFFALSMRPSQLNRRLFTSLGQLSDVATGLLVLVGVLFLIIEVAALMTGVAVTRTITRAVTDLYNATQRVQEGDLSHRVSTRQKDQLGALGESFNAMTSSVAGLIEEQRQRQRLENELAIAQQVQSQLFPQALPSVPGLGLAAVCRAARVVSGDYYDFISLGPSQLGIALADISGKGISAALLMASLQAALRSQVLLDGHLAHNTAELVSRLNRHLFLNTSTERYATFFYAMYDAETRTLHYTNAGHLPPFLVAGDGVKKLDRGGMVVGLFDNCPYEQGSVQVEPGSLLVAYSDGLIEPENVFGEQFGMERLAAEVLRHRHAPAEKLAELLVNAAEEWAGSQEQADDMTVIVARMD